MYKLLLILRYLRRKLAPMFAALAVTLCTAMVIIVISVMGGFLDMMKGAAKKLSGDVIVRSDLSGFPHYGELIDAIERLPEVEAATATVETFGLLNLDGRIQTVNIVGIDPSSLERVVGYRDTLYWKNETFVEDFKRRRVPPDAQMIPEEKAAIGARVRAIEQTDFERMAVDLKATHLDGRDGIVLGIAVSPYSRRDAVGEYDYSQSAVGIKAALTVVPITRQGQLIQSETREFTVVNEFKSGLYDIDANRVYVSFAALQRMLLMHEAAAASAETGEETGERVPARASAVVVRGKEGVPIERVRAAVERAADELQARHPGSPFLMVSTWRQQHATFLGAVEKEKVLVTMLFAIISVVAVAMIAVIFYMIVLEKTKDIGVLRALGASRSGVAGIFLGYGVAIGVVGAILGFTVAFLVVRYINEIQDFLGTKFGVAFFVAAAAVGSLVLGTAVGVAVGVARRRLGPGVLAWGAAGLILGLVASIVSLYRSENLRPWLDDRFNFVVWSPEVYYFDKSPSQVDPNEVIAIMIAAVVMSVIGSVVPAFLASRLDPVESLRYE